MDSLISFLQRFGAPILGGLFLVIWCANALPTYATFGEAVPGVIAAVLLASLIGICVRFPAQTLVGVGIVLLTQLLTPVLLTTARDVHTYIGFGLVLFFAGLSASPRTRKLGFTAAIVFALLGTGLFYTRVLERSPSLREAETGEHLGILVGDGIQFTVVMLGLWLSGFLLRVLTDRNTLLKERAAAKRNLHATEIELTLEQERGRISQELHDVLAHSLAVIAMQADGARYANQELPAPVGESLNEIARAARHALIDAQLVIEGVSDNGQDSPQPGIPEIPGLVETVRSAGIDVALTNDGDHHRLMKTQELAVFRIIQESLTNSVKHAPTASVTIGLDWDGPGLSIQVITAGLDTDHPPTQSEGNGGRGITGMKQRARTAGGWLTAEADDRGYRVTAFIPYRDTGEAIPGSAAVSEALP
ncbi:histidine kinase [Arthrobacter sp. Bz4]|uniref:sensor histidine kinase n=1 Tax=Arthrobacter sp. Bz4 TaxID=2171979 RepID=UPI000D51833D|nr:histidine kinase [Arthrobacter sp. Bz4]PVE16249.1 hypothetical protein DDA93_13165 [Arthrobacter sp. Bz4]